MDAVCLASGPSLTPDDVETVREWRKGSEDRVVIVANTTFRIAQWADAVFAMDRKWWEFHYVEVVEKFDGRRLTTANLGTEYNVEKLAVQSYRNSGAGCVSVAVSQGARSIALLGYDCMPDDGKTHWHGSHPVGLSDAKTIKVWPLIFDRLAKDMKRNGVDVVNASRRTALKCFDRGDIAELLHP